MWNHSPFATGKLIAISFAFCLPLLGHGSSFPFACAEPPQVKPEELPRIPPTPWDRAVDTIDVRPGFRAEVMAHEPVVVDPICLTFDEHERAYVIEMRDYSERRNERLGRVRLLTDRDGDGQYEHSTVFAEDLPWPTGVTCWAGGVFVLATPDLWYFRDRDGDGIADEKQLIATGLAEPASQPKYNVQGLANSLQWGPDQRIHCSLGTSGAVLRSAVDPDRPPLTLRGQDLSFDPRRFDFRAEAGSAQWGMSFDDLGRKFNCHNSAHLMQVYLPQAARLANPRLSGGQTMIAVDGPQAEVFRASPDEPWRVLRTKWRVTGVTPGLVEGGGRPSGYFTSACGVLIYRGDAYPPGFLGNAIVGDCGSNLIHRKLVDGAIVLTARRAEDEARREFVASRDNWFRPVAFANAPDGCVWVCDMYREVVEHPDSLPPAIKQHLDLNSGNDRGRLWRIVSTTTKPSTRPTRRLSAMNAEELEAVLEHPNGWHRDTAARLLHALQDPATIDRLRQRLPNMSMPLGRITALRVLAGLLPPNEIPWDQAASDSDPAVRAAALLLLESKLAESPAPAVILTAALRRALQPLAADPSIEVRFQIALLAPHWPPPERRELIATLCRGALSSAELRQVLMTLVEEDALPLWQQSAAAAGPDQQAFALALAEALGRRANPTELATFAHALPTDRQAWPHLQAVADTLARKGKPSRDILPKEVVKHHTALAETTLQITPLADPEIRRAAWRLLTQLGTAESITRAAVTLAPDTPQAELIVSLDALHRLPVAQLVDQYRRLWALVPSAHRAAIIQAWREHPALVPELLTAVEQQQIPASEISATDLAALRIHPDAAIQQRVLAVFGPANTREAALNHYRPATEMTGNPARGLRLFQTKCSGCHRKQGLGTPIGPDLETVLNAGKAKLLINILDPSREVTAGYVTGVLQTTDGQVFSGIIQEESSETITLKLPGKPPRSWGRAAIEEFQRSPKSLMPDGIEAGLSLDDMADLLEFLSTSGPVVPLPE